MKVYRSHETVAFFCRIGAKINVVNPSVCRQICREILARKPPNMEKSDDSQQCRGLDAKTRMVVLQERPT